MKPILALLVAALWTAGCDADKRPEAKGRAYGEPVGIRIDSQGDVPTLDVAFAVTKGKDPVPFVEPLASAIHGAAALCPEFLRNVSVGKTALFDLSVRGSVLQARDSGADDSGTRCMKAALGGKAIAVEKPAEIDVAVEIRIGTRDASTHA